MLIFFVSSLGNIKFGNDEEEFEFGFFFWFVMLFVVGMGVGLMFFGVVELLIYYFLDIISGIVEYC